VPIASGDLTNSNDQMPNGRHNGGQKQREAALLTVRVDGVVMHQFNEN